MNIVDANNYIARHKITRSECRDLSFGDTELFLENEDGSDAGGGYFSRSTQEIWLSVNEQNHMFQGPDAQMLRTMIPLKSISRNDNEGKW